VAAQLRLVHGGLLLVHGAGRVSAQCAAQLVVRAPQTVPVLLLPVHRLLVHLLLRLL